jgi:hypothetical protein
MIRVEIKNEGMLDIYVSRGRGCRYGGTVVTGNIVQSLKRMIDSSRWLLSNAPLVPQAGEINCLLYHRVDH